MGIIASGFKLIKESYDFVLQMAPRVHTSALQDRMEAFVNQCFQALRPLTYDYREVCEIKEIWGDSTYTHKLCIGDWLRLKSSHQTYGSTIDRSVDVFCQIRGHGDELKPHIRKPVKEDFALLVDLTKQLIPYDELLVKFEIPETTVLEYNCPGHDGEPITMTTMEITAIGIKTSHPWDLLMFQDGEKEPKNRDITYEPNASIFEDVITHMVDLFKKANTEVAVVREHNEKIIAQMDTIVAPIRIGNSLKTD